MLAELNWIFAVPASIFGSLSVVVAFALCICGWKTKEPKDEFIGVEGRVKITNPEEYEQEVNANDIQPEGIGEKIQNTAKRSLPDLPVDSQVNGRPNVNWESVGDAASELYATVVLQDEKSKKHNRQKSDSDSISPSLTYTKVKKDHPYDKLKKVEHPYAQVKENESEIKITNASQVNSIKKEVKEVNQPDEFDRCLLTTIRSGSESTVNIPAATAITGHVSASEDLPYMTPPSHFSGDSQDSGKGYTSISVREPLSAIKAESKTNSARRPDSHYATVSDDSDDMYAAIDDPSQAYTSESETYAQIHNRSKSAPQPPSVDSLKQMTTCSQTHSRQASSSSLASSTVISSPKPEKRPANSPLPPTPAKSGDTSENITQQDDINLRQSASPRNVEDMYAKVIKKGRRDVDLERGGSTESGVSESSDSLSFKLQLTTSTTESSRSCHSYLSKSTLTDSTSPSSSTGQMTTDTFSSEMDHQRSHSGYEKLGANLFEFDRKSDPGYETVNKGPSSESDPEYEKLKPQKHDYTSLERSKKDGFFVYPMVSDKVEVEGTDGYSQVNVDAQENEIYSKIDASESDGYACVEPQEVFNSDDGYAKVVKHNNGRTEPSYERVTFGSRKTSSPVDVADEKVRKVQADRGPEPTYESLGNELDSEDVTDPNYESVRFTKENVLVEPPYQMLRECESGGLVPED
ncbi:hypothetical protein RUM43_003780 [Polyplax serrata]|uniref:Uncharacterized protein n=1 Tax=Polyplax serrata TaxID=468196 RepID=A0AAN8P0K3_POLSC